MSIPPEWQPLMDEFAQRTDDARAMGGVEKLAKQRQNGRYDARQRIELLCDSGSFQELGTLVGSLSWNGLPAAPCDAIVGGSARIHGRPVIVASEDFTVQGGSIGFGAHAKRLRLATLALQERLPFILMLEGAGERSSNGLSRHPYAPNDLQVLAQLSGQVPTVALVMGSSAGHGALSGLMMDFVVMVEGSSLFSAGPPLVLQSLGEKVDKEQLGGATVHCKHSGVAHNRVADEEAAFQLTRQFLSYLPTHGDEQPPYVAGEDSLARALPELFELLPRNHNVPYDIRKVIRAIADEGILLEIQPEYGSSMVTGLLRLGGYSVAVVANQPQVLAGTINRPAAEKATQLLELAHNYQLPVLFLADNPGVLPGSQSERDGTLRACARMYRAQARLRSPKLHVTLRKAYGFGSSIMAMNPFDRQTLTLALPGIALGGIPALGGAEAARMSDEQRQQMILAQERAAWGTGDSMAYDEIIDPRQLRNRLLRGLEDSRNRRPSLGSIDGDYSH